MSIQEQPARALMSPTLVTIESRETLRRAARMMIEHHVHCLVVPPPAPGRLVGILTVKDVVQVLCEGESALLDQLRVEDAATWPAFGVQADQRVGDCIRLMRMAGVRSVPVLEGVGPVGILSYTDVLRAVAREGSGSPG